MTKPHATDLVKLYYRIGEVSQIVGVQPHVLRYWESEFRTIRPQKSSKGQRIYSRRDVEKLLRVKDLLKNQGFTIAGARKRLRDPTAPSGAVHEPIRRSVQASELTAGDATSEAATPSGAEAPAQPASASLAASAQTSSTAQPNGKSLRRALLSLRRELLALQREMLDSK